MKTLVTQRDSGNKAVTTISNQLCSHKWYPVGGYVCKLHEKQLSQKPGGRSIDHAVNTLTLSRISRSEETSEEHTDEEMDCEAGTRRRVGLRTHHCRHRASSHYTNWLGVTVDIQANWTRIRECERGHARMSHGTGETAPLTENISPLCRLSMLALSVIMALSAAVCSVLC